MAGDTPPTPPPDKSSSDSSTAMAGNMAMSAMQAISGAFTQYGAAKAAGAYRAAVAATNARLAALAAEQALRQGDIAASERNIQRGKEGGAVRTGFAGQGVDLSSGTVRAVSAATDAAGAFDELTIRNNAVRAAWGYKVEATNASFEGKVAQLNADAQATQSLIVGGMNAITEPTKIYSNYLLYSRYGKQATPPSAPAGADFIGMV